MSTVEQKELRIGAVKWNALKERIESKEKFEDHCLNFAGLTSDQKAYHRGYRQALRDVREDMAVVEEGKER